MRRSAPRLKIPLPKRVCPQCKAPFSPYRDNQKFCTPQHRQDYFWATHEIVARSLSPHHAEETTADAANQNK